VFSIVPARTDSVAERILSNWLALCLHQHIFVSMCRVSRVSFNGQVLVVS